MSVKTQYRTLKLHDQGDAVKHLQEDLNIVNFGFDKNKVDGDIGSGTALIVDGDFGPKTQAAVKSFQGSHHLNVDGIVGEKTWSKLNAAVQASNPRFDFRVISVQEFIDSRKLKVTTPKAVAVQIFSNVEDGEGRFSADISVAYPEGFSQAQTSVIVHTLIGVADDSVNSIRDRIELKSNQNKWEIVWVGRQYKCQSGRGHQDWSGSLCS